MHSLRKIHAEEGIRGFYKGYQIGLLTVPCHWSIYFTIYSSAKHNIQTYMFPRDAQQPIVHLLAAICGAVATDVATNPLWVVRTRLISQHLHQREADAATQTKYSGVLQSARLIVKEEGWRALYRGLGASLLGTSHVAVQFPLYEHLRWQFETRNWNQKYNANAVNKSDGAAMNVSADRRLDILEVLGASIISKVVVSCSQFHALLQATVKSSLTRRRQL